MDYLKSLLKQALALQITRPIALAGVAQTAVEEQIDTTLK
jgi:hypothetical protein